MFRPSSIRFTLEKTYHSPTIYALSTKPGRAAIGVVRVSGPASQSILTSLTLKKTVPKPRTASVRKLYHPKTGSLLDEALVLLFLGPKSYTGEDLLELHLHGGNAVVKSVMNGIKLLNTDEYPIRYAQNGELSQRLFQNGRFDLTEVEGIRELIDAETETQRLGALTSMQGQTKQLFQEWRTEIVKNVALMTTVIDFGEDHDIDEVNDLFDVVNTNIHLLESQIDRYLNLVQRSQLLVRGIKLTLLGPPNSGKSSLLNSIANKDAAIVSDIAGTTRDSIDIPLDIGGYKIVLADTTGIREFSDDIIELEGIKRLKLKSEEGDLVVLVLPVNSDSVNQDLLDHITSLKKANKSIVLVLNKKDLVTPDQYNSLTNKFLQQLGLPLEAVHLISCHTGSGITELLNDLTTRFKTITSSDDNSIDPVLISERLQDILINDVIRGFEEFKRYKARQDVVLATESLRYSIEGIGKITGETVGIEEILGVVFSSFCIGK